MVECLQFLYFAFVSVRGKGIVLRNGKSVLVGHVQRPSKNQGSLLVEWRGFEYGHCHKCLVSNYIISKFFLSSCLSPLVLQIILESVLKLMIM